MRRLALWCALALAGCAYTPMRFGLHVSELEAGTRVPAQGVHRASVYAYDATTSLRPEAVEWTFGGVFEPGSEPGTFRAKGPGQGTIRAAFEAGDRQVLEATLTAFGSAPVALAPTPVPTPAPRPTAAPTPAPADEEALILESYRLQGEGDYFGAIQRLVTITDPDWLPKVRVLLADWGEHAVDQGLFRARAQLDAGNRPLARQTLDVVSKLPLRPPQRDTERALRLRLGDRP